MKHVLAFAIAAVLIVGGCDNEKKHASTGSGDGIDQVKLMENKAAAEKVYSINDFKLRADLSAKRLLKEVGPPNQYVEDGMVWMVYNLQDGQKLWVLFSQPGFEKLKNAYLRQLQNGQEIEKTIFNAAARQTGLSDPALARS
ncbi:MAG: hypothetical protein HZA50_19115 [Planctomycetes bacterium]|nr:hypothetical protein [Planctomycetota bacterium]